MTQHSYLFTRVPRWKKPLPGIAHRLPTTLYSWLSETGSLTKRLRLEFGNGFAVKLCHHHWQPAYPDEAKLLSQPTDRFQLIREVILTGNGHPLILARTVLPAATIKIAHRNLSHLGNRPLGEVIFAYPDLELRERQFSHAEPNIWSPAILANTGLVASIWGRRTVYAIHQQPLLVAEFFLPSLTNTH